MKAAFTIATANYLAQAKTVAESFLTYNQDYTFHIVLLDKKDEIDLFPSGRIKIVEVAEIGIPYLQEMIDRYSIFELSNALKPFCAEYFLYSTDTIKAVLYFDSDIIVYDQFTEVDRLLESHNIVITPHTTHPLPFDNQGIRESDFLNTGIYNGGFFALSKTGETIRFLKWWKERLRTHCLVDLSRGLFVDQIWLNLVPLYFKGVNILKHVGYNVAFWNLHERTLRRARDGRIYINGETPLVFFHFSGYDIKSPAIISKYQSRISFEERPDIQPLYRQYISTVLSNGYDSFSQLTCSYYVQKEIRMQTLQEQPAAEQAKVEEVKAPAPSILATIFSRCKLSLRVLLKGA